MARLDETGSSDLMYTLYSNTTDGTLFADASNGFAARERMRAKFVALIKYHLGKIGDPKWLMLFCTSQRRPSEFLPSQVVCPLAASWLKLAGYPHGFCDFDGLSYLTWKHMCETKAGKHRVYNAAETRDPHSGLWQHNPHVIGKTTMASLYIPQQLQAMSNNRVLTAEADANNDASVCSAMRSIKFGGQPSTTIINEMYHTASDTHQVPGTTHKHSSSKQVGIVSAAALVASQTCAPSTTPVAMQADIDQHARSLQPDERSTVEVTASGRLDGGDIPDEPRQMTAVAPATEVEDPSMHIPRREEFGNPRFNSARFTVHKITACPEVEQKQGALYDVADIIRGSRTKVTFNEYMHRLCGYPVVRSGDTEWFKTPWLIAMHGFHNRALCAYAQMFPRFETASRIIAINRHTTLSTLISERELCVNPRSSSCSDELAFAIITSGHVDLLIAMATGCLPRTLANLKDYREYMREFYKKVPQTNTLQLLTDLTKHNVKVVKPDIDVAITSDPFVPKVMQTRTSDGEHAWVDVYWNTHVQQCVADLCDIHLSGWGTNQTSITQRWSFARVSATNASGMVPTLEVARTLFKDGSYHRGMDVLSGAQAEGWPEWVVTVPSAAAWPCDIIAASHLAAEALEIPLLVVGTAIPRGGDSSTIVIPPQRPSPFDAWICGAMCAMMSGGGPNTATATSGCSLLYPFASQVLMSLTRTIDRTKQMEHDEVVQSELDTDKCAHLSRVSTYNVLGRAALAHLSDCFHSQALLENLPTYNNDPCVVTTEQNRMRPQFALLTQNGFIFHTITAMHHTFQAIMVSLENDREQHRTEFLLGMSRSIVAITRPGRLWVVRKSVLKAIWPLLEQNLVRVRPITWPIASDHRQRKDIKTGQRTTPTRTSDPCLSPIGTRHTAIGAEMHLILESQVFDEKNETPIVVGRSLDVCDRTELNATIVKLIATEGRQLKDATIFGIELWPDTPCRMPIDEPIVTNGVGTGANLPYQVDPRVPDNVKEYDDEHDSFGVPSLRLISTCVNESALDHTVGDVFLEMYHRAEMCKSTRAGFVTGDNAYPITVRQIMGRSASDNCPPLAINSCDGSIVPGNGSYLPVADNPLTLAGSRPLVCCGCGKSTGSIRHEGELLNDSLLLPKNSPLLDTLLHHRHGLNMSNVGQVISDDGTLCFPHEIIKDLVPATSTMPEEDHKVPVLTKEHAPSAKDDIVDPAILKEFATFGFVSHEPAVTLAIPQPTQAATTRPSNDRDVDLDPYWEEMFRSYNTRAFGK